MSTTTMTTTVRPKRSDPSPVTDVERVKLDAALAFIRKRFADGITLKDVGKAAGISPFHLHRRFHFHFGFTPKAEMYRLQIERAKALMSEGVPLSEVARQCGFSHQSHLTHRFKVATTLAPMRWIRAQRANGATTKT